MPPEDRFDRGLSRRDLLRLGMGAGVLSAGAVLLPSLTSTAFGATPDVQATQFSTDLYVSPDAQRFSLVLIRPGVKGLPYVSGPKVDVRFKAPSGEWTPFTTLRLDTEGLPKNRGVYRTASVFDQPGNWKVQAKIGGTVANSFLQPVKATADAPVPGEQAPRASSPTTTDALGVNPICTRVPPCPLHMVSLSDVIGTGKPVAVLFATPALCTSMYCGPVLDEMLKVMTPYQERVTFVHVEIYKGSTATTLSPTVEAWGIQSEPWLFGIDGAGAVTARLDTAFGKTEMVALFDHLIAA
jgi:hypothetical protein